MLATSPKASISLRVGCGRERNRERKKGNNFGQYRGIRCPRSPILLLEERKSAKERGNTPGRLGGLKGKKM